MSELSVPVTGLSAYSLIRRYQPHWLQKRGRMTLDRPTIIKVYVDSYGSAYGGIASLRKVRAEDIAYIKHYSPREAQFTFGSGNMAGAIFVQTEPLAQ